MAACSLLSLILGSSGTPHYPPAHSFPGSPDFSQKRQSKNFAMLGSCEKSGLRQQTVRSLGRTVCCWSLEIKINRPFFENPLKIFTRGLPQQLLNRCVSINLEAVACISHSSPQWPTWRLKLPCREKCRLNGPAALFMSLFPTAEPSLPTDQANSRVKNDRNKAFPENTRNSNCRTVLSYRR